VQIKRGIFIRDAKYINDFSLMYGFECVSGLLKNRRAQCK